MTVVQFPDYRRDNPYQQLLANALRARGIATVFPEGYRRILPFSRTLLATPGADVLHLHWLTPYLKGSSYPAKLIYSAKLWFDCQLVKVRGARLIWTVHNLVSHDTRIPKLEIWLSRHLARLADHLIVHSEGARSEVVRAFRVPEAKVSVIPHGSFTGVYGPPVLRSEARARLGLDQDRPVFLFFGMIKPYKGVENLLQVWKQAPHIHRRACLVIAGDARDPELAAAIQHSADQAPNVHLHMRFVPDKEVPVFFGAADFVILPFTRSLTSGTAILARGYRRPVLASAVEGTMGGLDADGSEFFNAEDRGALTDALGGALERSKNKQDQVEVSLNLDDWDDIAAQHEALYIGQGPNGRTQLMR